MLLSMKIKKNDIWIANMNPQKGTEVGKNRPVVVIQTDLLNKTEHSSTIILPITTNIKKENILRIHIDEKSSELTIPSDILIDQIRAIDNSRLIKKIGSISNHVAVKIEIALKNILDFH